MNSLTRNWKLPLTIWIISCFIFVFLVLTTANTPVYSKTVSNGLMITVIVGVLSFLVAFIIAVNNFSQSGNRTTTNKKNQPINPWLYVSFILFAVLGFLLLSKFQTDTKIQQLTPSQIECYVDGRRIEATREDCQALSIKKIPTQPSVIIQQQAPTKVIPTFGLPKIRRTNCYWSGSSLNRVLNCTEY